MDLHTLIRAWAITEPCQFHPLSEGYMNLTHRLESADGAFVLSIYQAVEDLARIRHEQRITQYLSTAGLSFRVPAPIATPAGERLLAGEGEQGPFRAALIPFFSGNHAARGNLADAAAQGQAIGELSRVMGAIPRSFLAEPIPLYGELERVHPDVSDPEAVLRELPLAEGDREELLMLLDRVRSEAPALYSRLPQQLIHGDYTRENSLIEDGRVSAILDFEFSGWDLRVIDFATGLGGGPEALWQGADPWALPEAYTRGYRSHQELLPEEVASLPAVIRLRRMERLMQFAGRFRQGHDRGEMVRAIGGWVIRADRWLAEYEGELVHRVASWV